MNTEHELRRGYSNQTGRVTCATSGFGRGLAGKNVGQALDVDFVEDAPPTGNLEPGYELGPEDVDLAVQDATPVADVPLFCLEFVLQLLELLVRERAEIRERFHRPLAFPVDVVGFKRTSPPTVNLNLRIQAPD